MLSNLFEKSINSYSEVLPVEGFDICVVCNKVKIQAALQSLS